MKGKGLLSLLLCAALVFGLLPITALAEQPALPPDANGGDETTKAVATPSDVGPLSLPATLAAISEQFNLVPGGTYYFDLWTQSIPGTVNAALPDSSLKWVPFTYAGTVNAYSLDASSSGDTRASDKAVPSYRSLFVSDYITHTLVSWNDLSAAGLIFGKTYSAGGIDYKMRSLSAGSAGNGKDGDNARATPESNEWDQLLNKGGTPIKNWSGLFSFGQDTCWFEAAYRTVRGNTAARYWMFQTNSSPLAYYGLRPALEILNPAALGPDGLKTVTYTMGGKGTLGNKTMTSATVVYTGSLTLPEITTANGFTYTGTGTGTLGWFDQSTFYAPGTVLTGLPSGTALTAGYDKSPTITGPTSLTLGEGYGATSTDAYTITGSPAVTVTKISGDAKITWNSGTKKLDIAAGLAVGSYPVALKAANGALPDATLNFTLTIEPSSLPAFKVTGSSAGYTYTGGVLTFRTPGDYTVSMTIPGATTTDRIVVNGGTAASPINLTLNGVSIVLDRSSGGCAFDMAGATVNLSLEGANALQSGYQNAGLRCPAGAAIVISDGPGGGIGSLSAIGGNFVQSGNNHSGAGIGGSAGDTGGDVTVRSGAITATGGDFSAGIGGTGGTVTITDGTINASGGNGAGIGGSGKGLNPSGGNITISGGVITAASIYGGAGIGGGCTGDGGNITISGGMITATGGGIVGGAGAGIGGGSSGGSGGRITITGGTVHANGGASNGYNGSGIGGGCEGNGGTIYISGGSVKAAAGGGGAQDIGNGVKGSGGTLQNNDSEKAPVFLTTVTLAGVNAETAVTSLTANLSAPYGTNDMFTDSDGKLYLYLPAATELTGAGTGTTRYTGNVITTADAATSQGTLSVDTTQPIVTGVTPAGTGVVISTNALSITFNEPMNTAVPGVVEVSGAAVSAPQWSNRDKTVTYSLSGLAYGATYTVMVADFQDVSGNLMLPDNTWRGFTTEPAPTSLPAVTTDTTVTGVTSSGARVSGNVTSDGGAAVTARGFVYSKTANPAIGGAGVTQAQAGSGTGTFAANISGLLAGTTYHVRAYATNSEGTSYGADVSFTTLTGGGEPNDPYIFRTLTDSATGVTVSGAIHRDAALAVGNITFGSSAACDAIRQRINGDRFITLFARDISLSHGFTGTLTITIPVGSAYNGETVAVYHCVGGTLQTYAATVTDGKVTFTVTSLSPFAVFADAGILGNIPKTGDGGSFPLWIGLMAAGVLLRSLLLLLRRRPKRT